MRSRQRKCFGRWKEWAHQLHKSVCCTLYYNKYNGLLLSLWKMTILKTSRCHVSVSLAFHHTLSIFCLGMYWKEEKPQSNQHLVTSAYQKFVVIPKKTQNLPLTSTPGKHWLLSFVYNLLWLCIMPKYNLIRDRIICNFCICTNTNTCLHIWI